MKNLYYWHKLPKDNKAKEFQVYLSFGFSPSIDIKLGIPRRYEKNYIFYLDILNMLNINIQKTYETDHAGFNFSINILGFNVDYSHYDIRHWDRDNDTWCKYDEENE